MLRPGVGDIGYPHLNVCNTPGAVASRPLLLIVYAVSRVDLEHALTLATLDTTKFFFGKSIVTLQVCRLSIALLTLFQVQPTIGDFHCKSLRTGKEVASELQPKACTKGPNSTKHVESLSWVHAVSSVHHGGGNIKRRRGGKND